MLKTTSSILVVLSHLACFDSAWGAGFALIEHSASGMGSAFAGAAAVAEDPSTIWFNPAGMSLLREQQFSVALHGVLPSASYSDRGSYLNPALTGDTVQPGSLSGADDTTNVNAILANLYYVVPFKERYRFGIGINTPFGLATDYADDWVGRYHATDSHLRTININPALAWQVTDNLSFGLGVSVQYAEAELTNRIDSGAVCLRLAGESNELLAQCLSAGLLPNTVANDSEGSMSGDDWGFGFNLGLLYQFNATDRIGLAYRSEVAQTLEGEGEFSVNPALRSFLDSIGQTTLFTNTGVTAAADMPASASVSGVFALNQQLTLLADITWTGWSSFQELRVVFDNPIQPDSVTEESWGDSMRYALGLNYRQKSRIWRMGIAYDETPIPDPQRRTPRIPGNDRTWLAFGVGLPVFDSLWLDLGYAHLFVDDTPIDHTDQNGYALRGIYQADVDIFSLQATMTF
jgi:long-chain fatty acid transport protein